VNISISNLLLHSLVLGLFVPLDHDLHVWRPPLSTGLVRSVVGTNEGRLGEIPHASTVFTKWFMVN